MNALLRLSCLSCFTLVASIASASEAPCQSCQRPARPRSVYQRTCIAEEDSQPSWIFRPSNFTHDPETGARVAQYERIQPVEPLEDERNVTSRYRRVRTNLRGADGSTDSTYEVQAWGNGRGGLDAEWERFHDAWKESYLQGGFINQGPANGNGWSGWGTGGPGGWGPGNWGPGPGYWGPGQGNWAPGPGNWGGPGFGPPGNWGPTRSGSGPIK